MGISSSKVKLRILFSSYAGSPLFTYRIEVNGRTLINPPGLSIDKGTRVTITPVKDNAIEGEPVTLEDFKTNVDLSINVIASDESPGFKAIYTINNTINRMAIFYYPNDNYHKEYNTHIVHTNIKSVDPSVVFTKDGELTIYATDIHGGYFGPELVLPLDTACSVHHVIADKNVGNLRVDTLVMGSMKDCEKYLYIEPV